MAVYDTSHALQRLQQRDISKESAGLVHKHADKRHRVKGGGYGWFITHRKCRELIRLGYASAAAVDRAKDVRLIMDCTQCFVLTVEYIRAKRRRIQERPRRWRIQGRRKR